MGPGRRRDWAIHRRLGGRRRLDRANGIDWWCSRRPAAGAWRDWEAPPKALRVAEIQAAADELIRCVTARSSGEDVLGSLMGEPRAGAEGEGVVIVRDGAYEFHA